MIISIIAAIGERNRVIGRDNDLPWSKRLRPDMERFVALTTGHPVIMGRKTWDSIPPKYRPLSDRTNIVVSRRSHFSPQGAAVTSSLVSAIELAKLASGSDEIFLIGGGGIYREGMSLAQRLYLTLVGEDAPGDTFFPEYDQFVKVEDREIVPDFSPQLTFLTLGRV